MSHSRYVTAHTIEFEDRMSLYTITWYEMFH